MRNHVVFALMALLLVLLASGCPRNPEGEEAPPIDNTPPAALEQPQAETPPAEATPAEEVPAADASGETAPAEGDTGDAVAADGAATTPPAEEAAADTKPAAGKDTVVVFETTKGLVEITVRPEWAPIGAEHFLKLVEAKYYDGAPWFRVIDGFVAQVGVAADPAVTAEWAGKTIKDEPVVKGNAPGTVCFGKSGAPNSRSTHIFINYANNSNMLDPQGFACFGEVTKGMDVVQKFHRISDNAFAMAGLSQPTLSMPGGLEKFKQAFPEGDYVLKAYIKK